MSSSRPMIRTTVAIPTTTNAFSNASWLSRNNAASPVTPYSRSLPDSVEPVTSRIFWTASSTACSSGRPLRPTLTIWTCLFGETACGPVIAPVTRSILASVILVASSVTLAWSAAVSSPPAPRLTTMLAVASLVCPKASAASFCACTDSYLSGRKAAWSLFVTSASVGAKATTATAAITQAAITFHGLWTTNRPSLVNTPNPS